MRQRCLGGAGADMTENDLHTVGKHLGSGVGGQFGLALIVLCNDFNHGTVDTAGSVYLGLTAQAWQH